MRESALRNSVLLRMILVGLLGLVLMIPVALVFTLVSEREGRRDAAALEVAQKWGLRQTLAGPVLSIPVRQKLKDEKGNVTWRTSIVHNLPENLAVTATLSPEIRYRGIYRVVLYTSRISMKAHFNYPDMSRHEGPDREILWSDAFLTLGISDLKGIKDVVAITWDNQPLDAEPGLRTPDLVEAGITMRPALRAERAVLPFTMEFSLNGSQEFNLIPVGKETTLAAEANWGDPSFIGDFLPEKRQIDERHFAASWRVLHLNRNFPQTWVDDQYKLRSAAFGVRLLMPVDEYQKNSRAVKYAVMFIALTFLAFLMVDVLTRNPFHPVHYTLVSLALILFYVLLLSISEYLPFNSAYLIASVAIILMISLYTRGISSDWKVTGVIAGILILLYGFLFVVLQLEDYALLLGSIGLFVILGLVMYLTRKIDWFAGVRPKEAQTGE